MFFTDAAQEIAPALSDTVTRTAKYFECDKEFTDMNGRKLTITEAEADAAAASFAGGDFNLEHKATVLDGHLGRVSRLWRDGKDIMAECHVPRWLHDVTGGKPLKISSEWDGETRRPLGAGLVLNPAVKDAVMMAAFSEGKTPMDTLLAFAMTRHNTPEGQMAMQDIHDMSARSGAVCDRKNVTMSSQHEMTAVQKIHDIAADHGANCKSGDKPSYYSQKEKTNMTAWEKFVAFCKGQGMSDADATELAASDPAKFAAAPGMTEAEKAQFSALQQKAAAFEAETNRLKSEAIARDAAAFADAALAARRAVPAERVNLIAAFTQAATDDASAPATVSFSAGAENKTGSRVDALKALVDARPAHTLTQDSLAQFSGGSVLPSAAPSQSELTQADVDDQVERMLSSTPVGQKILAAKKK